MLPDELVQIIRVGKLNDKRFVRVDPIQDISAVVPLRGRAVRQVVGVHQRHRRHGEQSNGKKQNQVGTNP